jgi:hypothetical protein
MEHPKVSNVSKHIFISQFYGTYSITAESSDKKQIATKKQI